MFYRVIEKTNLHYQRRVKIICLILLCAFILILVRAGWVQIIQGERFFQLSQTSRLRLIPLPNPRGLIMDRKGRVIADNTASFSVGVVPENLTQPDHILQKLKEVFPELDVQLSKNNIKTSSNPFRPVIIREDVDLSTVTYLLEREQEFPSVVIFAQPVRNYPRGGLLGNTVGYLG